MNEAMKQVWLNRFSRYVGSDEEVSRLLDSDQVPWTTLGEYLEFLEAKGVSTISPRSWGLRRSAFMNSATRIASLLQRNSSA